MLLAGKPSLGAKASLPRASGYLNRKDRPVGLQRYHFLGRVGIEGERGGRNEGFVDKGNAASGGVEDGAIKFSNTSIVGICKVGYSPFQDFGFACFGRGL